MNPNIHCDLAFLQVNAHLEAQRRVIAGETRRRHEVPRDHRRTNPWHTLPPLGR